MQPGGSYAAVVEAIDRGFPFALALVLSAEGSTPGKTGMRALIGPDGRIRHTIGGGLMEARVQAQAVEAIVSQSPRTIEFTMQGPGGGDAWPICGGKMRILLDPAIAKAREAYVAAANAQAKGKRGVLLTSLQSAPGPGAKAARAEEVGGTESEGLGPFVEIGPDVRIEWLAESAVSAREGFPDRATLDRVLANCEAAYLTQEGQDGHVSASALVEPIAPKPLLIILGAGHVGQAVARLTSTLGFDLAVVDDRPDYIRPELFPQDTKLCCGPAAEALSRFPITKDTYLLLVARGYLQDSVSLAACMHLPAAYIGMIGSRRKVALVKRDLIASRQCSEEQFSRIHAPVGLDIGAITVPEIAVSIAAQLIAVRRRRESPRFGGS